MKFPSLLYLLAGLTAGFAGSTKAADQAACYHRHAPSEIDIGYCEAKRVGNLLYISGSVGQGETAAAIRMAYDALKATLEAHGLGFRDVVKETVYATDLDAFIANKAVRKAYYGTEFPAATWVQVQRLYLPAYRVEVELIVQFPQIQQAPSS